MLEPLNINFQKWQMICRDADWIAANYPTYGRHQMKAAGEVLETALYIGLDALKEEIVTHPTLEWVISEKSPRETE